MKVFQLADGDNIRSTERPPNPDDRRLQIVECTEEFVWSALRGECRPWTTNLPADATVRGMFLDHWSNCIGLYVHSMTFDAVPEGARFPIFTVQMQEGPPPRTDGCICGPPSTLRVQGKDMEVHLLTCPVMQR